MILARKRNNWKSMKIAKTIFTPFPNLHFWHFQTVSCNFCIFFSEGNSWNQLNNWKKIIPDINTGNNFNKWFSFYGLFFKRMKKCSFVQLGRPQHRNILQWNLSIQYGCFESCQFRLFLVSTSEQIGRWLPVFTLLLWQRQHIIVVDAVDYK